MTKHFWQDENGNVIPGWVAPPYSGHEEYPEEGQNYFHMQTILGSELRLQSNYPDICREIRSRMVKQYDKKKFMDPNNKIRIALFYSAKVIRRFGFDKNFHTIDELKLYCFFNAPLLSEYETGTYATNTPPHFPLPTDPAWIDWRA